MSENSEIWPPKFTLDQEKILNLLTGDRFYSNPSAAFREAVLNAIDALHRRQGFDPEISPRIDVSFDRNELSLTVSDNGIGMSQKDISALFTKVGASAADTEKNSASVGEFGIGVVSYFMAGDSFDLHTFDGETKSHGLTFSRNMLAGGGSDEITSQQSTRGTTVILRIRDEATFQTLLDSYAHWCRDVDGLVGHLLPENEDLEQGGRHLHDDPVELTHPDWIEHSHLYPVADSIGWDAMTGSSRIAVLYRGVFVQEFEVRGIWGINGSIDVNPKQFKPRLNREGFIQGKFQAEVEAFLRECHPTVLEAMANRLREAVASGELDKWTEQRWASLWLSVPRSDTYKSAIIAWDAIFRQIPAFELAVGNKWEAIPLERFKSLGTEVYVALLADENPNDVVKAAMHLLRNTGKAVIRGLRKDNSWMRFAPATFGTTADLISSVFAAELPRLIPVATNAERILAEVSRSAPLYSGPPQIDLVQLGPDSPPALRLKNRLVINTDHPNGAAIAIDALRENSGPNALIAITARHAYEQLSEVAAAVREITADPEILSPIRRRYIKANL